MIFGASSEKCYSEKKGDEFGHYEDTVRKEQAAHYGSRDAHNERLNG